MIELIPAIDIIDGQCVRLRQGEYEQKTVYGEDPLAVARHFEELGFRRLHIVDLDGAKSKQIVNKEVLRQIAQGTSLTIDFGGGIKRDEDIEAAFDNGASMVTVGSIAVTDPERFTRWLRRYGPERIVLGADVRNGRISINGWKDDSHEELIPFLDNYIRQGVKNVLCTEISRDGMLSGPATELYKQVLEAFPELYLIASGGVAQTEDIFRLEEAGLPAVVFGKAFYEGRIDISRLPLPGSRKKVPSSPTKA